MSKNKDKNTLAKKPIWFLFLAANVIVLIGCAITMSLFNNGGDLSLVYLPTLICNLLALIAAGVFMYFEIKDIAPQIMHFRKKWLKFYIAAFSCFVATILFNVLYFLLFLSKIPMQLKGNILGWQLWVYMGITMFLSLVSIGLQRYARFRIDLDIYRRKHGELLAQQEAEKQQKNDQKNDEKNDQKNDQNSAKKSTPKEPKKPVASGGLLDQME